MKKLKEEISQCFDGVSMVSDTCSKMEADIPCYLVFWQTWKNEVNKQKRLMKREEVYFRF